MKPLSPAVTSVLTGTLLLAATVIVGVLPLHSSVRSIRDDIDRDRLSIATVEKQQRNIVTVSRNFSRLQDQQRFIDRLFLREERAVDFFNRVDELFSKAGASDSVLRLDTPTQGQSYQTVGVHITFTGTYDQTLGFLRSLSTLDQLVRVTGIQFSAGTGGRAGTATLEGIVPWEKL